MARIGVDWGSSSFRAYRFSNAVSAAGETIDDPVAISLDETRDVQDGGIKFVTNDGFEAFLFQQVGDWLESETKNLVLLSGMITSRNGWIESPYMDCPADPAKTLATAERCEIGNTELIFLPGLSQHSPLPDVMRGEELQLLGAGTNSGKHLVIMPGTHSKWSTLENGLVTGFRTIVTGELFEILLAHSLVGQLAEGDNKDERVFLQAVSSGYKNKQSIAQLFACRAGVLLGHLDPADVRATLSGLLIGSELREGFDQWSGTENTKALLIGSEKLCHHYILAFEELGLTTPTMIHDSAARGYARLFDQLNRSKSI